MYLCYAICVWFDIAQVTSVANSRLRTPVLLAEGVEMRTRGHTPIGIVSELVHMETVLAGRQSGHFAAHFDRTGVRL